MKLILTIAITLFIFTAIDAQQTNQWRGMVLDQTTPEQALEAFGKPKADKIITNFRPYKYDEWFDYKKQSFRMIQFDKPEGFKDVKLFFKDGLLSAIELNPIKLEASLVSKSYGVPFEPIFDWASNSNPDRFATDTRVNRTIQFPTVYEMMHKGESSYIFVLVSNVSLKSTLGTLLVGPNDDVNSVPGKAARIQIISRALETTKGNDLLK
jgi:hypothetical protein